MGKLLDKVKIGISPITRSVYLYRHGKDENEALEKRDVEKEIYNTVINHLLTPDKDRASVVISFGMNRYELKLERIDK